MKNIIPIQTTNTRTGAVQFWWPKLESVNFQHTSHLLSLYGERADTHKLDLAVSEIRSTSLHAIRVIPLKGWDGTIPVSNPLNRCSHRGYEDGTPFIIRVKRIGEVEGAPSVHGGCYFRSTTYGEELTKAQSEWLNERFGQELAAAINNDLLADLQVSAVEEVVTYAKNEIAVYRKQLDQIEAYQPPKA